MVVVSIPSLKIQRILFYIPYVSIALTGLYVLIEAIRRHTTGRIILPGILGFTMVVFLLLYTFGIMGNHYLKVYSMLLNFIYLLLVTIYGLYYTILQLLFQKGEEEKEEEEGLGVAATTLLLLRLFCIPEIMVLFWFPQIGYIINAIVTPSISEIIPNKLYLGNAAIATKSRVLADLNISHVLELCDDDSKKNNDPSTVNAELLQLKCSDSLGSDLNIINVAPRAVEFIDDAITITSNKNNNDDECNNKNVVLVHCSAGVSRSPAIVVYWLVQSGRIESVEEAVQLVQKARPIVDISCDHLDLITKFFFHEDKKKKKH